MQVLNHEALVGVDVDQTLLLWHKPTVPGPEKIAMDFAGDTVYLTPHDYHVKLVKMYKKRGYHVTVWSANGRLWAADAVRALGLEAYVDVAQTKMTKVLDDSTADKIVGQVVFCEDLTKPEPLSTIFLTREEVVALESMNSTPVAPGLLGWEWK